MSLCTFFCPGLAAARSKGALATSAIPPLAPPQLFGYKADVSKTESNTHTRRGLRQVLYLGIAVTANRVKPGGGDLPTLPSLSNISTILRPLQSWHFPDLLFSNYHSSSAPLSYLFTSLSVLLSLSIVFQQDTPRSVAQGKCGVESEILGCAGVHIWRGQEEVTACVAALVFAAINDSTDAEFRLGAPVPSQQSLCELPTLHNNPSHRPRSTTRQTPTSRGRSLLAGCPELS